MLTSAKKHKLLQNTTKLFNTEKQHTGRRFNSMVQKRQIYPEYCCTKIDYNQSKNAKVLYSTKKS